MKYIKYLLFSLVCIFASSIVFAAESVIIKSITPIYDEDSTIVVNEDNSVIFNNKDQSVEYKVVLENTTDKNLIIEDISLSEPTENFLIYELKGLKSNDVLKSNSTQEVIVSLSTVKKEGWGRNFNDQLTANISFIEEVSNPNTSNKGIIVVLISMLFITGILVISVMNRTVPKYIVSVVMFVSVIGITYARESLILPIKINASYVSQNVMHPSYIMNGSSNEFTDYWQYNDKILNIYIENEYREITEYEYKFDVSQNDNGKVMAYLVKNSENPSYYDLYLIGDGVIYFNQDSSSYFQNMKNLTNIVNLAGVDTSLVTNMSYMFYAAGYNTESFALDLSSFNTVNVTAFNYMFFKTAFSSSEFTLDLSSFNTSKVTDMSGMFASIAYSCDDFVLDISSFDTSNVTKMYAMFNNAGYKSAHFQFFPGEFDTSSATDLTSLFQGMGASSDSLNFSITFSNPDVTSYKNIFTNTAIQSGSHIDVHYTEEAKDIANDIMDTVTSNPNIEFGKMKVEQENLSIGDEVHISGERFNVMSITDDSILLLAQYNLDDEYRQNEEEVDVPFSNRVGWEYIPGPKEIDIYEWSTNPASLINEYVMFLKNEIGDDPITGDLITLKQLEELGCVIPQDYEAFSNSGYENRNCTNSQHKEWLVNGQYWWTKSAESQYGKYVWVMFANGNLSSNDYDFENAVRPVITISKSTLEEYLKA